jgi:hypothetical protein
MGASRGVGAAWNAVVDPIGECWPHHLAKLFPYAVPNHSPPHRVLAQAVPSDDGVRLVDRNELTSHLYEPAVAAEPWCICARHGTQSDPSHLDRALCVLAPRRRSRRTLVAIGWSASRVGFYA